MLPNNYQTTTIGSFYCSSSNHIFNAFLTSIEKNWSYVSKNHVSITKVFISIE